MSMEQQTRLTFSIDVQDVRQNEGIELTMTATEKECKELAARLGIVAVKAVRAQVSVSCGPRSDLYAVEGDIAAEVVQECSVTLAPVDEQVHEHYSELLTTSAAALDPKGEGDEGAEDRPIDLIEDGRIDIGEIVTQWLALGLNPYPRSEAPLFSHVEATPTEDKNMQRPFQGLQSLIEK